MPAEADFVIQGYDRSPTPQARGTIRRPPRLLQPQARFPGALEVSRVYHRDDAIWPFTSVGRPPQEDTSFGAFIHELTGPVIPSVVAGVDSVHAVDAAGSSPAAAGDRP